MPVINLLEHNDYDVYPTTEKCDKAIILCGKHENPTVFDCKTVLFYHKLEWNLCWEFFESIITEYYDKMIDVTDLSLQQTVNLVIDETNKS